MILNNKKYNCNIFLQARIGSTRLPGKLLYNIYENKTILEIILERFNYLIPKYIDKIIICTTENTYPKLKNLLYKNTEIFIGSEENVLERFVFCLKKYPSDVIIRATADNPFVSLGHLIISLKKHIENQNDLTHFLNIPIGSGVEIISPKPLLVAYSNANKTHHFEHVTPYIYENKNIFKVSELFPNEFYNRNDIRLTVDEKDDFILAQKLYEKITKRHKYFSLKNIINTIDITPELKMINLHVKQKNV